MLVSDKIRADVLQGPIVRQLISILLPDWMSPERSDKSPHKLCNAPSVAEKSWPLPL